MFRRENLELPRFSVIGSSPRAWGTRLDVRCRAPRFRFIPTCVGNTQVSCGLENAAEVHPHVRGEHSCFRFRHSFPSGSSPRAWGTHLRVQRQNKVVRFIPTCVGNTVERWKPQASSTVHPHVRGEHVRGSNRGAWLQRFIPTCVGNTSFPITFHTSKDGSSPRAWGTRCRERDYRY